MRRALTAAVVLAVAAAGCSGDDAADTTAAPATTAASTTTASAPSSATSTATSAPTTDTSAPGGTPPTTAAPASFEGLPLPQDRGTFFSASGACAVCHQQMTNGTIDVSIDSAWRSTMMANAARDPYWAASVRAEVGHNPALGPVIEDKCATCHMPMARTTAALEGGSGSVFDAGFTDPGHPFSPLAVDGVSCTLCHQIDASGLGDAASFSGGFVVAGPTAGDRALFGPYDTPPGQATVMASSSGFVPVRGDHIQSSDLCATCHTLYTPTVDSAGEVVGEFAEQTPYLEWLASEFAQTASCQDCHLPEADGSVQLSITGGPLRAPFSQHHFVGGNAFMVTVFRHFGEDLGVTASSDHFETTLARIEEQLTQRTARLAVTDAAVEGGVLRAAVAVTNLTGHKFPTGFPSRRAWLHVAVRDGGGTIVFESGRPEPTGAVAGNDNDRDPAVYEAHYAVVTDPEQVQVYESIVGDTDGAVTTVLLRGAGYLKDNRMLPAGFDPTVASPDVLPAGAASGDADFGAGGDVVLYEVDVSGAAGPFTIEAELLYQSIGFRWADNLLAADGAEVVRFGEMLAAVPMWPVQVAAEQITVP
jgi:hypothetical protein